jgi:uncharacterized protein YecE (DUF72 family)
MSGPAVAIGIAGWSYADWKRIVYPRGCKDELRFCARLVDCIEINSTFYRPPQARLCASWAERTADLPAFFFTAKLPQEVTHERHLHQALIDDVHEGFAPLCAAGKLRMLLAQFNFRFVDDGETRAFLQAVVAAFDELAPIAIELRHRSWAEPEALAFLGELGASIANLDYPGAQSGFGPWVTGINGRARLAYFRLHGRNAQAWFAKDAGRDQVYDWLYTPDQVEQLAGRTQQIAAEAAQTIVIANNHFEGKELKLALELKAKLHGAPVAVPETLLATYPDLAGIAASP